jgi:hypothetical protein
MIKKTLFSLVLLSFLASCSGKESTKIKSLQRKDKKLSCKEILLEMNEAEFYRDVAHKNRGPKLQNILMPLGYISTYMDAAEAIDAADARVTYLDRIYQIMRCDEKEARMEDMDEVGSLPFFQMDGGSMPNYKSYAR